VRGGDCGAGGRGGNSDISALKGGHATRRGIDLHWENDMIRRATLLFALVFCTGACRFQGQSLGEAISAGLLVNEMQHASLQRLAIVLAVERLCGCGQSDLAGAAGQHFEVGADFPCEELPGASWPIHVMQFSDGEQARTTADLSRSLAVMCNELRAAVPDMRPVGQLDRATMEIYVGERPSGRPVMRVACAAFEKPERPGVVEVVILSVERLTESNLVALGR